MIGQPIVSESGYVYNETLDPSSFTLRDDQMKRAMIKWTALQAAEFAQMLQAIEIIVLFLTAVVLIRVRKKSIKDIFNLKITFSELLLCVFSLIRLLAIAIISGMSYEYLTNDEYRQRAGILQITYFSSFFVCGFTILWLLSRTLKSFNKDNSNKKSTRCCWKSNVVDPYIN